MENKSFVEQLEEKINAKFGDSKGTDLIFMGIVGSSGKEGRNKIFDDWLKVQAPNLHKRINAERLLELAGVDCAFLKETLGVREYDMIMNAVEGNIDEHNGMGFLFLLNILDNIIMPTLQTNKSLLQACKKEGK